MYGFLQNFRRAQENKIMQYHLRASWLSVLENLCEKPMCKNVFSEEIRARYVQRWGAQYDKRMGL